MTAKALNNTTTMNVSLPTELARYVRQKVESGRYSSVSEVIREALRLLADAESGDKPMILGEGPARTLGGARYDRERAIEAMEGIRRIARSRKVDDLSLEDLPHEGHEE